MRFARTLGLMVPLLLIACDDEFNYKPHSVTVDGEGYEAVLDVVDGNCVSCHSGEGASAGLDLDTDFCGAVLDGRIVVEGDSAGSVLYQRITDASSPMPPEPSGLMEQSNIDIVRDWIDDGADCSGDDTAEEASGEDLYASRCAGCHGDAGQGVSAPPMTDVVPGKDQATVEDVILNGSGTMSPIGVTAEEAALIAEHVLATWGG